VHNPLPVFAPHKGETDGDEKAAIKRGDLQALQLGLKNPAL
jgi:hypothetical protein